MNCKCSDLVYVVICSTCNEEYIGETGKSESRVQGRLKLTAVGR